ncbi:hypothetical protein FRC03_012345 [Tulasnella sp. 419]|nr:hypothetical protein FRC02_002642 [Tulasnella sp. 418]KAG8951906.1 hypothetical protein FRC03_012345 [Tulasnella sp. 419]
MPPRLQGWDPVLIISQIVCLQSLHYLTLCIIIPPLLSIFAEPHALAHQGGAPNVSMIMDWRELAGRPTLMGNQADAARGWSGFKGAWSGGKNLGDTAAGWEWNAGLDSTRGWLIAFSWLIVCGIDIIYIYHLIRKPTHVLDFTLTLLFNHIILTTYYSASLPTSLFFWLVVLGGAAITVIFAEQLCVKREMQEGLGTVGVESGREWEDNRTGNPEEGRLMASQSHEDIELSTVNASGNAVASGSGTSWRDRL